MNDRRSGIFEGDDPFDLVRAWLAEATATEPNDPNAMQLATVDPAGMPNVRTVLLKDVEGRGRDGAFVFYTNYESAKGCELAANARAAFVMHWKSLHRQVRARGPVEQVEPEIADAYYASRGYLSRIGAWASAQSRPLESRAALLAEAARMAVRYPKRPPRPPHWGGFRLRPVELEFWADGANRMHDRFRWTRADVAAAEWAVTRLNP